MIKIFKKKWFWVIAVIVLAIIALIAWQLLNPKPAVTYTTESAKKGNLVQTVTATGGIESAHDINLNFKSAGKITFLSAKEGLNVKVGDVLARLDSGSINATIKQNEANLAAAKANLAKVNAGASSEDIRLVSEQLAKAQNDYDSLIRESDAQIKILKEKTIDSLNNAVFTAQSGLNVVFRNLINSETTVSLLTSDSALQNKVNGDYQILINKFDATRASVESAKASGNDQAKIVAAADAVRSYLTDLNGWLDNSYKLTDKIIVNTTYTQADKDAIKTDIGTQQSSNNTSLTAVQTARSNLVNTANSYESQIQAAAGDIAIAQAQLNIKQAGPRDFDVAAAQAQVNQAQATLNKSLSDASDYVITAPIDGQIIKVNYSIGENSDLSQPVISMLGNGRYEIKVDIPESDITKIKVGDKVTIELDAFGSDHPFSGAITFIDPAQTIIKDVIYYKTTVGFNQDSWNDQIKPGMTANITIVAAEKNNALYIPQRAVKIRETTLGEVPQKYAQVLVNGQVQEKNVEIGLRGDNGLVEIISGLVEGDNVITFTQDNTKK